MRHITEFLHNFSSRQIATNPKNPTGQDHPSGIFTMNPPITSPPVAVFKMNQPITSPMFTPPPVAATNTLQAKPPITSPMFKGAFTNLFS